MTEPATRFADVRVGSTTDGLTPVSMAERSLAASLAQWVGLATIAIAALLADQLTKHVVAGRRARPAAVRGLGARSILDLSLAGASVKATAPTGPVEFKPGPAWCGFRPQSHHILDPSTGCFLR